MGIPLAMAQDNKNATMIKKPQKKYPITLMRLVIRLNSSGCSGARFTKRLKEVPIMNF
jgi:hypothetical protein